jgi:predicted DNA-binding helix-hairpin-helix protein
MVSPIRPNWDLQIDAKLAWALHHREQFPVDVNQAPREVLLRIPGIGARTVDRILETRRRRSIQAADMRKLRVPWHRVRYFVATGDHHPRPRVSENDPPANQLDAGPRRQLDLFEITPGPIRS